MAAAFQYKSKVEISYDYILDKIMSLQFKAGDRVVISQVSKECGVSDIPVREALRMLQQDGYVTIEANRGAVISGVSNEAIIDMIRVKGVLEAYATRLSADYLSEQDLQELRDLNNELWQLAKARDVDHFKILNPEFHSLIYKNLPNHQLLDTIEDMRRRWGITRTVFQSNPERMERSCKEHDEIIDLLEKKDYDGLEAAVRAHKFSSCEQYMND